MTTSMIAFVHALSQVDDTVTLGDGAVIWQFASVIRRSVIGTACKIASCAIVDGARVGDGCSIGHGAFIGPGTVLENDVFVAPNVTICNDAWPTVAKDDFDLDSLLDGTVVSVRVRDHASLGAGCVVLPGVTVGIGAFVAAGATCDRSVPPECLFKRNGAIVKLDPTVGQRRMRRAP